MRAAIVILSLVTTACVGNSTPRGDAAGNTGATSATDGNTTGTDGVSASDGASTSTDANATKECIEDADCPTEKPTCAPQGVCIFCYPGTYICDGDVSLLCSQFGENYEVSQDCAANGGICNPLGGKCESACGGGGGVGKTNAGCDFVAVDLENAFMTDPPLDAQSAQFAVIASNTSKDGAANDHAERANYDQTRSPTVAREI